MSRRSKDVVKEGFLYKCPQKEGLLKKSWNRRFFVLYKQSSQETARLEYYDDEWSYGRGENKRIIPLRDCHPSGVYQVSGDKTNPCVFEVNTPGASHRLAAHSQPDLDSWVKTMKKVVEACQEGSGQQRQGRASVARSMTMPTKARQANVTRRSQHVITATPTDSFSDFGVDPHQPAVGSPVSNVGPETSENLVYNSVNNVHRIRVRVKSTEASFRLGLSGDVFLLVAADAVQLQHISTGEMVGSWPLQFIRRYGRDAGKFSFEAGRRCGDVAGMFEFQTTSGNAIFHKCQENINLLQQSAKSRAQPGSQPVMPQLATDPFARTQLAATAEFPQQPPPYQGSHGGHAGRQDAVDTGLATLSRSSRKKASAAAQFHASAGSQLTGPQKPVRMHRSISSESNTIAQQPASRPAKGYDQLKRNSIGSTFGSPHLISFDSSTSSPSQHTAGEIFASPYTNIDGVESPSSAAASHASAEIFASPYTDMAGGGSPAGVAAKPKFEIFASPYTEMNGTASATSTAAAKPTVRTRSQGGGKSSRPPSFQRGFDEVASTMAELDDDLELLTQQLDTIPSLTFARTATTRTEAAATTAPALPPDVPKPSYNTNPVPALPPDAPKPSYDAKPAKRRQRNPFVTSTSMEEPAIGKAAAHPVNPFAGNSSTSGASTSSPPQQQPQQHTPPLPTKKNRRSVDASADYERYEENAAPPPIPKKGAASKSAADANDKRYDEDLTPPLPTKMGIGSKPADQRGAVLATNYDPVSITSGPPVAAYKHSATAAATDAPKPAASRPHQYGNVVHHTSVDLSSVKLRSINTPSAAATNPFAAAVATQDKPPPPIAKEPLITFDQPPLPIAKQPSNPFAQRHEELLTHTGYSNVTPEQRQNKHAHGGNPFEQPFEQQLTSSSGAPPPPIAKPNELTHTGYTNVSRAQGQAPTFDLDMYGSATQADAPPPPAPKPHDLVPTQSPTRQHPPTMDPFSSLTDDSPYRNVTAGAGSQTFEGGYEAVEREDEIGAYSGSDNDDPFG